ncbi:DNA-methyltransferase [Carnobacterium maltaromaticum]|uniref:DNA-methyltransferase n=1 Tax=Carnobacterium maltaromaticum TaxID=2751 RepID=UPI00191BA91E|nr:site-specific DNA-methyltransferase [Carnobacterium maltaromaticum]CAD5896896.1 Methyltransferase [Carnobacterium maltaromaticum]
MLEKNILKLNKIYNEDCIVGMKRIPDKTIDAIVTDPPYGYLNHKLDANFDEDAVFREWDRILKDDGFLVLFGRGESFYRWNYKLNQLGFKFKEEIIWNKRYSSSPVLPVQRFHETVTILSKKGKIRKVRVPYLQAREFDLDKMQQDLKRVVSGLGNTKSLLAMKHFLMTNERIFDEEYSGRHNVTVDKSLRQEDRAATILTAFEQGLRETSIITEKRDNRKDIVHPTQKPVALMERLINLVSDQGSTILDPFSGSSSTLLAAKLADRNFIGFEIDKEYFDISVKRIQDS